jgi:hypothetical protein
MIRRRTLLELFVTFWVKTLEELASISEEEEFVA